jgi:hypothetical protein
MRLDHVDRDTWVGFDVEAGEYPNTILDPDGRRIDLQ